MIKKNLYLNAYIFSVEVNRKNETSALLKSITESENGEKIYIQMHISFLMLWLWHLMAYNSAKKNCFLLCECRYFCKYTNIPRDNKYFNKINIYFSWNKHLKNYNRVPPETYFSSSQTKGPNNGWTKFRATLAFWEGHFSKRDIS